jgi:hypothetical protein
MLADIIHQHQAIKNTIEHVNPNKFRRVVAVGALDADSARAASLATHTSPQDTRQHPPASAVHHPRSLCPF